MSLNNNSQKIREKIRYIINHQDNQDFLNKVNINNKTELQKLEEFVFWKYLNDEKTKIIPFNLVVTKNKDNDNIKELSLINNDLVISKNKVTNRFFDLYNENENYIVFGNKFITELDKFVEKFKRVIENKDTLFLIEEVDNIKSTLDKFNYENYNEQFEFYEFITDYQFLYSSNKEKINNYIQRRMDKLNLTTGDLIMEYGHLLTFTNKLKNDNQHKLESLDKFEYYDIISNKIIDQLKLDNNKQELNCKVYGHELLKNINYKQDYVEISSVDDLVEFNDRIDYLGLLNIDDKIKKFDIGGVSLIGRLYSIPFLNDRNMMFYDREHSFSDNLIITIENNNSEIVGFMSLSKTKDFYDKSEHLSIKKQNSLKIALLSVNKYWQGQGISDMLYQKAIEICNETNQLLWRAKSDLTSEGAIHLSKKPEKFNYEIVEVSSDANDSFLYETIYSQSDLILDITKMKEINKAIKKGEFIVPEFKNNDNKIVDNIYQKYLESTKVKQNNLSTNRMFNTTIN